MDDDTKADELSMMRAAVAPCFTDAAANQMLREITVHSAIRTILSDRDSYAKSLNYAVDYCRMALHMKGEDLRVQCLYILCNITRWRHPEAKEVRAILKAFTK